MPRSIRFSRRRVTAEQRQQQVLTQRKVVHSSIFWVILASVRWLQWVHGKRLQEEEYNEWIGDTFKIARNYHLRWVIRRGLKRYIHAFKIKTLRTRMIMGIQLFKIETNHMDNLLTAIHTYIPNAIHTHKYDSQSLTENFEWAKQILETLNCVKEPNFFTVLKQLKAGQTKIDTLFQKLTIYLYEMFKKDQASCFVRLLSEIKISIARKIEGWRCLTEHTLKLKMEKTFWELFPIVQVPLDPEDPIIIYWVHLTGAHPVSAFSRTDSLRICTRIVYDENSSVPTSNTSKKQVNKEKPKEEKNSYTEKPNKGKEKDYRLQCKEIASRILTQMQTESLKLHFKNSNRVIIEEIAQDMQKNNTAELDLR